MNLTEIVNNMSVKDHGLISGLIDGTMERVPEGTNKDIIQLCALQSFAIGKEPLYLEDEIDKPETKEKIENILIAIALGDTVSFLRSEVIDGWCFYNETRNRPIYKDSRSFLRLISLKIQKILSRDSNIIESFRGRQKPVYP